jgi:hypothetical protein
LGHVLLAEVVEHRRLFGLVLEEAKRTSRPQGEAVKKKFKAVVDDSVGDSWQVWSSVKNANGKVDSLYAEFHGRHCRRYARAHAKMLNLLPEKDQP